MNPRKAGAVECQRGARNGTTDRGTPCAGRRYSGERGLLLVGSNDEKVLQLNQSALEYLNCEKQLTVVPRATHLFEEPGTLEAVARHGALWFQRHHFI